MSNSTRLLSSAVVAAALGVVSFAAPVQAADSKQGDGGSATYPTDGGAPVQGDTYGRADKKSRSTGAGASGGGGSGMGTDASGTAGTGNRTDAEDMKSGSFTGSDAAPGSQRSRDMRGTGSDTEQPAKAGSSKGSGSGTGSGSRKDREPHSSAPEGTGLTGQGGILLAQATPDATGGRTQAGAGTSGGTTATDAAGPGAGRMTAGTSWLPYTTHGYVGGSLGQADFDEACVTGVDCDDPDISGKLYTGGMFNEWLGAEVGFIHFGRGDHGTGRIRAHGLNLSLVGAVPISQGFDLFGKLGTTYGWTRTSGAGTFSGSEDGFGWAWGVGASMDVAPNWAVTLEWERHDLDFATGKEEVDLATLGLKYKF